MSDSQRPKPLAPSFEVPDLDLEPLPRSVRGAPRSPSQGALPQQSGTQKAAPQQSERGYSAPNLFEDDAFTTSSLSLELDAAPRVNAPVFGSSISFEDPGSFELEPNEQPALELGAENARPGVSSNLQAPRTAWPSGRTPDPTQLKLDPIEIGILADYGEAPKAIQLTPGYAFRVFTRQRALKRQLLSLAAQSERAQFEREATLAELARSVRPAAEQNDQFKRFLTPLVELEQVASQRGQALSSINAQLNAQTGELDANLTQIAGQISAQEQVEQAASQQYDEREAAAKRADAKLKRVHIEMRAVTQVAEQKLGPQGGAIPEPEARQLHELKQRAQGLEPEVLQTRAELARAQSVLEQARAKLDALRHSDRQTSRRKHALGEHYQKEVQVRAAGVNESEAQQRKALADLGLAVLAAQGTIDVPEAWLEQVRAVSARADQLLTRLELQHRAIDAYDRARVAQGVRLTLTVLAVLVVLIVLKLAL